MQAAKLVTNYNVKKGSGFLAKLKIYNFESSSETRFVEYAWKRLSNMKFKVGQQFF